MKIQLKSFHKSLPTRIMIPVVTASFLVGAGLYIFVLRAVSDFADQQIREGLKQLSSEVYDICDRHLTVLMQSGQMDNPKAIRIHKALSIGMIEDYAKRNHLGCLITDKNTQQEWLSLNLQPALKERISHHASELVSAALQVDNQTYYFQHMEFNPWRWHIDLVKSGSEYEPLIRRVKLAYLITAALLILAVVFILVIIKNLLQKPLNQIISAIQQGKRPIYRGINEFEFLSDNLAGMMKSLEERNEWIKDLYHTAITNRGAEFFQSIAESVAEALGLDTLVLTTGKQAENQEPRFQKIAYCRSRQSSYDPVQTFTKAPFAQIVAQKQPLILPTGAAQQHPALQNLSDEPVETFIGVPFFNRNAEVIGMVLAFGPEKKFGDWELNLIKTTGQMVAAEHEFLEKEQEQKNYRNHVFRIQKLESLGILAGGIAHDFNNLLMGIQGNCSLMLLDAAKGQPEYQHLTNMEEYVQRGILLTRQLLGLARGGKYLVKPTDINELIRNTVTVFGRTRKELTIHESYHGQPWTVEVDRGQIEQVLLNLLINAWQAMPNGGDLLVETRNIMLDQEYTQRFSAPAGKYVQISIKDSGIGMDKTIQEKIFDPFFTTKEKDLGTGLGLASTYGIVKNHGGIIEVESEPGQGATFTIFLPFSGKDAEKMIQLKQNIATGNEMILLIDDENMVIDVGRRLLEKLGYQVLTASSGRAAVDIFEKEHARIELVILDMIMPQMGGSETFDRLRAIDADIRVLLSSGYNIDGQATEILNRGCRGFIQKPFTLNQLSAKVREILGTGRCISETGKASMKCC
jgi:two-component system cell cycle sensor histidine kinase/response regulator CckA